MIAKPAAPWALALIVLAALAVLAGTSNPASGQGAKPVPGCSPGTDKKGDVEIDNLDITGAWFNYTSDEKPMTYLSVANLHKELPADSTGIAWYVLWTFDGAQRFVTAQIEVGAGEPTFSGGTVVDTGANTTRQREGDTPGKFYEGTDGVIEIQIPDTIGGAKGTALKGTTSDTYRTIGIPGVLSSLQPVDEAAAPKAWTVGPCSGAAPLAGPVTTPTPGGTANPPGGRVVVKDGLKVAVSKKVPAAKKVKKSLAIKLTASEKVTGIAAALFQGAIAKKKIVAKGKLASAQGKATLKLKVSKKLKKGAYTLYLVGNNADGTAADRTAKLKFK